MALQYPVRLTEEQVEIFKSAARKSSYKPKIILHIKALLLMDKGEYTDQHLTEHATSKILGISVATLSTIRKEFYKEGVDGILNPVKKPKKKTPVKFGEEFEAKLSELLSEKPPEGRKGWMVRSPRQKLVELKVVESISIMTVQRALKNFSP